MQIISTELPQRIKALRCSRYFSSLSEELLAELAEAVSLRRYERGEAVCWQDDPSPGLFIVESGSVKIFKLSPQGRELIVTTFAEDATFNEVPVFDGGPNPVNVAALEESKLWLVEPTPLRSALSCHPEVCTAITQNLCQNLRHMVSVVEELSFYQVTNRLARLLDSLPPEALSGSHAARLTQDQIAARLGTVREVVARSLRELERAGAIHVGRRQIQITNPERLREWF